MNWGYKLLFVFIAFGGFMGYMVYSCIKTPVSLVTTDYYRDELNYQQVIDGSARARKLPGSVALTKDESFIQLQLPGAGNDSTEGKIWFYCVNDGTKDQKYNLQPDENGMQRFVLEKFKSWRYIAKIEWKTAGSIYYTEKDIIIP